MQVHFSAAKSLPICCHRLNLVIFVVSEKNIPGISKTKYVVLYNLLGCFYMSGV